MFVIFFTNPHFFIYFRGYFLEKTMKQFSILILLPLILISCGQAKAPVQSPEERLATEILSEDAQSTEISDAREAYEASCETLQADYFTDTHEAFSYQIVTELQSEESRDCLLGYYYGNESGIYTYVLYNLSTDTLLWEVTCEPDYDVEQDIMNECDSDALQNLKMEYEYLLESYRSI